MNRRCRIVLGLALLVAVSCDRGPGDPPGLEGAGPLVAEFARVAEGLDDVASAVATRSGEGELPGSVVGDMTEVGEAARAVLHAAEPDGPAGVAALERALVAAANDVVRHLVTAAGGREGGPGRMVLDPPNPVAFETDAKVPPEPSMDPPPGRDRSRLGMVEAQERLQEALRGEIEHFVYVALLAHPGTRAALAPRLSPDDLPAEVPDDLNLPVDNREDWREKLFDEHDRLVVPSPFDVVAWRAFIGWTKVVNPTLRLPVSDLTSPATRLVR